MPSHGALHKPFTEELVLYDPEFFNFADHIVRLVQGSPRAAGPDQKPVVQSNEPATPATTATILQNLHHHFPNQRPRLQSPLIQDAEFTKLYHDFVRQVVRSNLEEDMLIFEHCPNLRIHLAGEKSLTSPHTDKDHQHSEAEINFWVPLTSCFGDASLWAESAPGKGNFHPFEVEPGQAVRFYGNQCLHFTRDNKTDSSRVSFDFRAIRMRDFHWSQVPPPGDPRANEVRWSIFAYYDVMVADGSILTSPEEWEERVVPALGQRKLAEEVPPALGAVPYGDQPAPASPARRAQRSPSPEHVAACGLRYGSQREARRHCARCGWIANRRRLLDVLCFSDSAGAKRPWIIENPDLSQPWGLGCEICVAARAQNVGSAMALCSAFADFSFGVSMPGLLFQPLLRHGNHAMRQSPVKGQVIVQQDMEHAAAQQAVLKGSLVLDPPVTVSAEEKKNSSASG